MHIKETEKTKVFYSSNLFGANDCKHGHLNPQSTRKVKDGGDKCSQNFSYSLLKGFKMMYLLDQNSFLSVKNELLVDFESKLKWDPIVILNNISWVHILPSEENNVVYLFAQIE